MNGRNLTPPPLPGSNTERHPSGFEVLLELRKVEHDLRQEFGNKTFELDLRFPKEMAEEFREMRLIAKQIRWIALAILAAFLAGAGQLIWQREKTRDRDEYTHDQRRVPEHFNTDPSQP